MSANATSSRFSEFDTVNGALRDSFGAIQAVNIQAANPSAAAESGSMPFVQRRLAALVLSDRTLY